MPPPRKFVQLRMTPRQVLRASLTKEANLSLANLQSILIAVKIRWKKPLKVKPLSRRKSWIKNLKVMVKVSTLKVKMMIGFLQTINWDVLLKKCQTVRQPNS